jgi:outer membrane biosynthesis protein TonB
MLNAEAPFHYPASLWAQRTQGSVTLWLFIDSLGLAVAESTRVATASGVAQFDSAALAGVPYLRFQVARLAGRAIAVPLLLPVFFRHPDASPLPGDSVIKR